MSVVYSIVAIIVAIVALFAVNIGIYGSQEYPKALIDEMISKKFKGVHHRFPLQSKVAMVTGKKYLDFYRGSTSGLGYSIASELFSLGADVIIASRNEKKITDTIESIRQLNPASPGTLISGLVDTSDLKSVQSFGKRFSEQNYSLNFLVNNAGIHYFSSEGNPIFNRSVPVASKQGFDLAFATNYLGHFLLTKLLLPKLISAGNHGRVINIASTYHVQADGTMLEPVERAGVLHTPVAAQIENSGFVHRRRAYGNNKLAQILHARELQRRLEKDGGVSALKVVSVCPGWVSTNILPNNLIGNIVRTFAFSSEAAALAPMCALFNDEIRGGSFVANYINFWTSQSWSASFLKGLTKLGIRDETTDVLAGWVLSFQRNSYGCHIEHSSPESYDENLARRLYDWSEQAVEAYV